MMALDIDRIREEIGRVRPMTWIAGICLALGIYVATSFVLSVLLQESSSASMIITDLAGIIAACHVLVGWLPYRVGPIKVLYGKDGVREKIGVVLIYAILFITIWFLTQFFAVWFVSATSEPTYEAYQDSFSALPPVVYYLIVLFLAPLSEELLFRGVLLEGLSRKLGLTWAVVAQAVVFAFFHGTLVHMIPMIFLGIYFGTLAANTGRIWPCVCLHVLHNALVLFFPPLVEFGTWLFSGNLYVPLIAAITVLGVMVALLWFMEGDVSHLMDNGDWDEAVFAMEDADAVHDGGERPSDGGEGV